MSGAVLVTGATGFLGRHVLAALAEVLPDTRAVALVRDRDSSGALDAATLGAGVIEGHLEDSERWGTDPALAECDGVVHLAGLVRHSRRDPAASFRTNVTGTQEMVRLAARLGCRLVAVSTSGAVGCSRDPSAAPDEEAPFADHVVGDWPYYASKIAAERGGRALAGVLDVDLVVLRPPVLLGPGDRGGRSTSILRRMRRRSPLILGGGYHFADVRDVARAVVAALRHPHPHPVYHLPGWNGTQAEFAHLIAEAEGRHAHPVRVPFAVAHIAARLLSSFGRFVDPVVVEMGRHHWNVVAHHSAHDLDYRSRDPRMTLRDAIASLERGATGGASPAAPATPASRAPAPRARRAS